jgi:hypothetical protein
MIANPVMQAAATVGILNLLEVLIFFSLSRLSNEGSDKYVVETIFWGDFISENIVFGHFMA